MAERNIFEKIFGSYAIGSSRVPLHSNIVGHGGGGGYSRIGGTGKWAGRGSQRQSPLLGNSTPSNLMSGYYDRVDDLKQYYLLDITKLATSFFSDYLINFLEDTTKQVVTIVDQEGNTDESKTERINDVLTKDLRIFDYIRDHMKDMVYWGSYTSLILRSRDELGHIKFRFEELSDPVSIISKKERDKDGGIGESFLARGEDGKIYEIPGGYAWMLGSVNLRLVNDLDDNFRAGKEPQPKPTFGKVLGKKENFIDQIIKRKSFTAGEPLFYSLVIKLKELIIKEILVSLISLRDLSSVQLFLLNFDKGTPPETAKELCARTTKLANNTNELASFLTSQFDVVSFVENTLSKSAKFVPDYNSTIGTKNSMIPLDKLSDKLLDIMQNLDSCRANILNPLGIPSSITDSASGNKWNILQQSERANSRVTSLMSGIKDSVVDLVKIIHEELYGQDLDVALIKLHISEKTSVEYNNQINQSESVSSLVNGISSIITSALQTLDMASPLIDSRAFLNYIQNQIKDIDPDTESLISKESIEAYSQYVQAKTINQAQQMGIEDTSFLMPQEQQ